MHNVELYAMYKVETGVGITSMRSLCIKYKPLPDSVYSYDHSGHNVNAATWCAQNSRGVYIRSRIIATYNNNIYFIVINDFIGNVTVASSRIITRR